MKSSYRAYLDAILAMGMGLTHPRFKHRIAQIYWDDDFVPVGDNAVKIGSPTIGLSELHVATDFLLKQVAADRLGLYNSAATSKQKLSIGTVLTMWKGAADETILYITGDGMIIGSTNVAPRLVNMTTAQRDALTGAEGMIIYNTTTRTFQVRDNAGWKTLTMV